MERDRVKETKAMNCWTERDPSSYFCLPSLVVFQSMKSVAKIKRVMA